MTSLDQLLLVSLLSVFLTLLLGSQRWAGWMNALLYLIQTGFVLNLSAQGYGSAAVPSSISLQVFGHTLGWQFDALSWFFALITVVAALLVSWYAAGEWGRRFSQQGGNLWLLQLALSRTREFDADYGAALESAGFAEASRFSANGDEFVTFEGNGWTVGVNSSQVDDVWQVLVTATALPG